ncbi:MAG: hypothetical protein M3P06_00835 [Acidobacteriota bacterium]|nr:hypothetical protein [Acidobacteriota bacterium]
MSSSSSFARKALALLIVVIATGLAPATAVIGFCAKLPCCFGEMSEPVLATGMAGCCSTISCYEAPSHDLTVTAKVKAVPPARFEFLSAPLPRPQVSAARLSFDDTSPPPTTCERLSSLSTFLI